MKKRKKKDKVKYVVIIPWGDSHPKPWGDTEDNVILGHQDEPRVFDTFKEANKMADAWRLEGKEHLVKVVEYERPK